jgi:hypothetical protein
MQAETVDLDAEGLMDETGEPLQASPYEFFVPGVLNIQNADAAGPGSRDRNGRVWVAGKGHGDDFKWTHESNPSRHHRGEALALVSRSHRSKKNVRNQPTNKTM